LILAGVVIVALVAFRFYQGGNAPMGAVGPALLAGAPAASFTVKRPAGGTDALANYRGKVVLVNLWATWCPPCRDEVPALEQLYRKNRAKGFVVLGIDQGESASVAMNFAQRYNVTFPVLIDDGQQYGRAYAAQGLPTSILVDRGGKIVKGVDGEMTLAQMQDLVGPALAAK
jgi:thiol-disulfide isomerase/thioredoxin